MNAHRVLKSSIAVLIALAVFGEASPAFAVLKIDITQGVVDPTPIAVSEFHAENAGAREPAHAIAGVVTRNLERSGLFAPIDRRAFIQTPAAMRVQPRFPDWRAINARALVTGTTTMLEDGRLRVEFRLWDVFQSQQMAGLAYFTEPPNWRRIAHLISDAIYQRLTGEAGYFDTRIVYVAETGPQTKRVKRLAIMDQDGAHNRYLTDGGHLVLTPRFSPTSQEITYLSYLQGTPRVFIYNIDTGQQEVLGNFPGMTFAPRFSPDGNKVIMSFIRDDNSDIYTMDLRTRRIVRLTKHSQIDTSPSYAPDGSRITFESDRGGSQQLYVMDADGGKADRISFGRGRYATPVWSPRGDLIAFTKSTKGKFFIGVMRPNGSGERLLTEGFFAEGPTWAPNGRVLMFYRKQFTRKDGTGGEVTLYSVDLTGHNERKIITPTQASDPAWSPLSSPPPLIR
jgi:TolB protein